jgi:hypothetical protein
MGSRAVPVINKLVFQQSLELALEFCAIVSDYFGTGPKACQDVVGKVVSYSAGLLVRQRYSFYVFSEVFYGNHDIGVPSRGSRGKRTSQID